MAVKSTNPLGAFSKGFAASKKTARGAEKEEELMASPVPTEQEQNEAADKRLEAVVAIKRALRGFSPKVRSIILTAAMAEIDLAELHPKQ